MQPRLPSNPEPVVEAVSLAKRYGRGSRAVEALAGVDLRLAPGECLGLLGVNGSGKSTTLRLVLGLERPTGGTLRVLGGPAGRRAARARTGYVPEEARRLGSLTGIETVRLFAALQGLRPRRLRNRRAVEALELVGLERRAHGQRVSAYSRGMARRLALAAAWVHRPALLVLDEPTSGLDPIGTDEVLALLGRHRRDGGAALLSTHDRVTAEGGCDRALVLRAGRVRGSDTLTELLAGDASPSLLRLLRGSGDA
jgi:ABC-2 type transport system ATP-binding protein